MQPRKLSPELKQQIIEDAKRMPVNEICKKTGLSKMTVYRILSPKKVVNHEDSSLHSGLSYLKRLEERLLPPNTFNCYERENWLI